MGGFEGGWLRGVVRLYPNCMSVVSSPALNVMVTAHYTSAPGETSEELNTNKFRAGRQLRLLCQVEGDSGTLSYHWRAKGNPATHGCQSCNTPTSNTAILSFDTVLYSYFAGTYTCTVDEVGRPSSSSSDSFTFVLIGKPHKMWV